MSLALSSGLNCVKPLKEGPGAVIALVGRVSKPDVERLCDRARELLLTDTQVLICDADGLVEPDAVSVDVIARLQLVARRAGRELRLRNACAELQELLDLAGLTDVIRRTID